MKVEGVKIGDCCDKKVETLRSYKGLIDYIDISSIDNIQKSITAFQTIDSELAPSRAKQLVKKNDVLVSTVRPNLNAVALIDIESDNILVASTGYCVLRCNQRLNCRYLYYFCQSARFIDCLVKQATGASYPAVNSSIVRNCIIPLPSIEDQQRIAMLLDKLSTLISLRKQQLEKLDELVKARFVEMFGDPVENPHHFDKVLLSELAEIRIGPFGSLLHKEDYIENGHPLVNPSHIVNGEIVTDKKLTVSDKKYQELNAYHLKTGDVVLGRRGEMGRCAVVNTSGLLCGTGSLLIRTKGEVTADYLQKIISFPSFKATIEDMAVGQTMPNLNVPIVSRFQIIRPPMDVQRKYYDSVAKIGHTRLNVHHSLNILKTLKNALMQEYFG